MPGFDPRYMIGRTIVGASLVAMPVPTGRDDGSSIVEQVPVLELDNGAVIVAVPDPLRWRGVRLSYLAEGTAAALEPRRTVLEAEMLAALVRRSREEFWRSNYEGTFPPARPEDQR